MSHSGGARLALTQPVGYNEQQASAPGTTTRGETEEHRLPPTVDKVLSRFKGERAELIPALQAVQKRIGYLPEHALRRVARHFRVPESTVFGVASFYEQFHLERQGRHNVKVCCGTACHIRGSSDILRAIENELRIKPGQTTPDYKLTLERVACFGGCALSPAVMIDGKLYGHMTPATTLKALGKLK